MTPLIPVLAAAGVGALLLLGKKSAPSVPQGGVIVPGQVVTVPHPSGQGSVQVQVPPTLVQPPAPGQGTAATGLPPGSGLGSQGFNNTIDGIINNVLNNQGVPQGPNTAPPPGDTGLQPLPPPQVVSDGAGGFTTVQPTVPGDLGTPQFGGTIDDIINQQLANAGQQTTAGIVGAGNNWGRRAVRAARYG